MKISAKKNGPVVIILDEKKKIKIKKEKGEEERDLQVIALCRCGASQDKPFCDGKHKEINFVGEEIELEI